MNAASSLPSRRLLFGFDALWILVASSMSLHIMLRT